MEAGDSIRIHKATGRSSMTEKGGQIIAALLVNNGDLSYEGGCGHDRCFCSFGLYCFSFEGRNRSLSYSKKWRVDCVVSAYSSSHIYFLFRAGWVFPVDLSSCP